jgi:hypothetical protein
MVDRRERVVVRAVLVAQSRPAGVEVLRDVGANALVRAIADVSVDAAITAQKEEELNPAAAQWSRRDSGGGSLTHKLESAWFQPLRYLRLECDLLVSNFAFKFKRLVTQPLMNL